MQDPVTPSVLKEAWDFTKLKYFGYLNKFSKKGGEGDSGGGDKEPFDRAMGGREDLEGSVGSDNNTLHRM